MHTALFESAWTDCGVMERRARCLAPGAHSEKHSPMCLYIENVPGQWYLRMSENFVLDVLSITHTHAHTHTLSLSHSLSLSA